jgi:hypothetical protein
MSSCNMFKHYDYYKPRRVPRQFNEVFFQSDRRKFKMSLRFITIGNLNDSLVPTFIA